MKGISIEERATKLAHYIIETKETVRSTAKTFGIKSIYDDGVDLRSCSEKYLKEIGMNDDEIASLREGLALSY